jgi:hypothetical protein
MKSVKLRINGLLNTLELPSKIVRVVIEIYEHILSRSININDLQIGVNVFIDKLLSGNIG